MESQKQIYDSVMQEAIAIAKGLKSSNQHAWFVYSIDYCRACCAIAVVQMMAGAEQEAGENFRKAVDETKKSHDNKSLRVSALCHIAVALKMAGDLNVVEQIFDVAMQVAREMSEANQAVAEVYAMRGDVENARWTVERIEHSDEMDAVVAHQALAIHFAEAGKFHEALQEAEKVRISHRHYSGLLQTIAAVQAETGDVQAAEKTMGDEFIHILRSDIAEMKKNPTFRLWRNSRLEYALMSAWAVKEVGNDLNAFRDVISGIGPSVWRVKSLMTFAKHLVESNGG